MDSPYSICSNCGDFLDEGMVYGEWDDFCQECFNESAEDEAIATEED